ncbi:MAG: glycoside hydrolase family 15 protein [Actinobacteria bacterium]|nr:glycoside hydrolase family 15 protein [Actinomycetota bacterium]MBM3697652.1 glycoside hydrolase family 15 protein [Actinomycetota bacterium]
MNPARSIEDHALIGDKRTCALVARDGAIDWFCTPRFDGPAVFCSLLGTDDNGEWRISPQSRVRSSSRRYVGETLVLETTLVAAEGTVRLVDFMSSEPSGPCIVRIVEGVEGVVPMESEVSARFEYGHTRPWVRHLPEGADLICGPEAMRLVSPVHHGRIEGDMVARFTVKPGQRIGMTLNHHESHLPAPAGPEPEHALAESLSWWEGWSSRCPFEGEWREPVIRSLITLKALSYAPTGAIIAAATTSLPERLGGVRNWDYRFAWLRDASFTLYALMLGGYTREAVAWRDWLLRAVAGDPEDIQIMYGAAGERRLAEWEVPWLPGYAASRPVRVGNAAVDQFQLDVYGELMDSLHVARRIGVEPDPDAWSLETALMDALESRWHEPDEGIWEVRGPRRHFTHSKIMAWVAFDRAICAVEESGLEGPVDRWKAIRQEIHDEVCREGFNAELGSFVQAYDVSRLDASLLMIPLVGFLPADDPRVIGTMDAIQRDLTRDGLVMRYTDVDSEGVDGLPAGEGAFLLCTYWLVDNLAMAGRYDEARVLFERLLTLRNDVGLMAEQWDPITGRMLGNFPQAFSHVGLVNSAWNLGSKGGAAARWAPNGSRVTARA